MYCLNSDPKKSVLTFAYRKYKWYARKRDLCSILKMKIPLSNAPPSTPPWHLTNIYMLGRLVWSQLRITLLISYGVHHKKKNSSARIMVFIFCHLTFLNKWNKKWLKSSMYQNGTTKKSVSLCKKQEKWKMLLVSDYVKANNKKT